MPLANKIVVPLLRIPKRKLKGQVSKKTGKFYLSIVESACVSFFFSFVSTRECGVSRTTGGNSEKEDNGLAGRGPLQHFYGA